jgi:hypothetical protein
VTRWADNQAADDHRAVDPGTPTRAKICELCQRHRAQVGDVCQLCWVALQTERQEGAV